MTENTVQIAAELPEPLFNALVELAKKRGVSADTALQRAIETETYLAEKERQGGSLLIEDSDRNIKRIVRK